jgi:glyoxylate/hydroxypyruvate reductase A
MTEIAVCFPLTDSQMQRLQAGTLGHTVKVLAPGEPCDSPVVFGNPEPGVIAANDSLRWLQLESVGLGEYLGIDWSRPAGPVKVTNLASFFANPAAQSALAGILALYRAIDRLIILQTRAEWQGGAVRPHMRQLAGATVVLFGFGSINRRLAEMLAPFDCTITPLASDWTEEALNHAISSAEIVVSTVPAMPLTEGIFDAARFAAMPTGAIFCNFGRGSVVDEPALEAALRLGHLGGAVIDVTREEPLPPRHPFWTCPNLLLTQHSGGGTFDEVERKIDYFLANLANFHAGRPLTSLVDFSRGY